jgi:hypothetical protein
MTTVHSSALGKRKDSAFHTRVESDTKQWINRQLSSYIQQLLIRRRGRQAKQLRCLFLESSELNTMHMLQELGVLDQNMCVPNDCTAENERGQMPVDIIHAALPDGNVIHQSLNSCLRMCSGAFDFIFADYCGRPEGRGKSKTPADDVFQMSDNSLLSDGSIVAFTFSRRGPAIDRAISEFEVNHGKQAVRCGYAVTCMDKLYYKSMICMIYYVVKEMQFMPCERDVYAAEALVSFRARLQKEEDSNSNSSLYGSSSSCTGWTAAATRDAMSDALSDVLSDTASDVMSTSSSRSVADFQIPPGFEIVQQCPAKLQWLEDRIVFHITEDVGQWTPYWCSASVVRVYNSGYARMTSMCGEKYKLHLKKRDYCYEGSKSSSGGNSWFTIRPIAGCKTASV